MPTLFFPFGEPWSEFEAFLLAQSADDDEVTVKTWDQASDWDREWWARDFPYPTFTYQMRAIVGSPAFQIFHLESFPVGVEVDISMSSKFLKLRHHPGFNRLEGLVILA